MATLIAVWALVGFFHSLILQPCGNGVRMLPDCAARLALMFVLRCRHGFAYDLYDHHRCRHLLELPRFCAEKLVRDIAKATPLVVRQCQ